MAGIYKLEIQESLEKLKKLLQQQKTATGKERVQLLYLLKTTQAQTIQQAAQLLGRHQVTMQDWVQLYCQGGMTALLVCKNPSGRHRAIPAWSGQALQRRLQEPEAFDIQVICQWLEDTLGIKAAHKTVYNLVHQLQASLKVPHPVWVEQSLSS